MNLLSTIHAALLRVPAHLREYGGLKPRPCSHLTAAWAIWRIMGEDATKGEIGGFANKLWSAINIYDHSKVWGGLNAVAEYTGNPVLNDPAEMGYGWYIVQRWDTRMEKGHSYLAHPLFGGGYRVLETSLERGYRDHILQEVCPSGKVCRMVRLP